MRAALQVLQQQDRQSCMRATPLWQTGFHDHALRREEDLQGIARYLIANPFRAGLALSARDYPHWDAIWL